MTDLELKEILARIDERLLYSTRTRQEMALAPWLLAMTGLAAGAGLAAALLVLVRICGHS